MTWLHQPRDLTAPLVPPTPLQNPLARLRAHLDDEF